MLFAVHRNPPSVESRQDLYLKVSFLSISAYKVKSYVDLSPKTLRVHYIKNDTPCVRRMTRVCGGQQYKQRVYSCTHVLIKYMSTWRWSELQVTS